MAEQPQHDNSQDLPVVLPYAGAEATTRAPSRWPTSPFFWIAWLASGIAIGIVLEPCFGIVLAGLLLVGARRHPRVCAALGLIVAALFAGRDLTAEWRRPMFHNRYGRNDRMFFNAWYPPRFPEKDELGNKFTVDYRLNLLLIAMNPNPRDEYRYVHEIRVGEQTKTDVQTALGTVSIPRTSNQLVIVFPDGTRAQFPLKAGQAEQLSDSLERSSPEDILTRLEGQLASSPQAVAFVRSCRQKLAQALQSLGGSDRPLTRPATPE